jgi:hypothetical protein
MKLQSCPNYSVGSGYMLSWFWPETYFNSEIISIVTATLTVDISVNFTRQIVWNEIYYEIVWNIAHVVTFRRSKCLYIHRRLMKLHTKKL